jgi:ABC-type multidrug transport system fused ATPase/permease subunit
MLVMQVLTEQHYFQNIYQVSVKIRYGLVALLYRKLNRTTITRIKTSGQFFNLISMDLNEIDSGLTWFLALSGSIIVGTVGSILLYVYFGPSCTIGIGVLIAVNVASRRIIDSTGRIKAAKNKAQDGRTRMTSEVLHNIRALKTFAIELLFRDKLVKLRSEQDQCTYRLLVVDALAQCMTGNLSVFVSLMAMMYLKALTVAFRTCTYLMGSWQSRACLGPYGYCN